MSPNCFMILKITVRLIDSDELLKNNIKYNVMNTFDKTNIISNLSNIPEGFFIIYVGL